MIYDQTNLSFHDARFLSLYTPDSAEEIFTYAQQDKTPTTFQAVQTPMLVIFAEKDEYRDRSTSALARWFEKSTRSSKLTIKIIPKAIHSFARDKKNGSIHY